MRTRSSQDKALLEHPTQGAQVYCKVEMTRTSSPLWGSETWVDLTDLYGYDWVLGVTYSEDLGAPAWRATVTLLRQIGSNPLLSLSPFMSAAAPNSGGVLVQPYRKVRISTAYEPMGTPRDQATFRQVFVGRVDDYRIAENEIRLNCRDRTGELQDYFIERETEYGSDTPLTASSNDLEDLIQAVLDDLYNTTARIGGSAGSPFTLYSRNGTTGTPFAAGDATNWSMRTWPQRKMGVFKAIKTMAETIGYQLRFRWHEGSGINDFVLVLEAPESAKTTADLTLDPTKAQVAIDGIALSNTDVRNFFRVGYALNGGEYRQYEDEDASSINKYGYRPAEVIYDASNLIDTPTEATSLVDSLLAAAAEPTVTIDLTLPYAYYVQLNDLVGVLPDGRLLDTEQKVAVVARRNIIQRGKQAVTQLTCQGKPKFTIRADEMARDYSWTNLSPTDLGSSIRYGGVVENADFGDQGNE